MVVSVEEQKRKSEEIERAMEKARAERKTSLTDVVRWAKQDPSIREKTFEEYRKRRKLPEYGESLVTEGKAYYEVPVEATTGEQATVGMTQAVLEKYEQAKRQELLRQQEAQIRSATMPEQVKVSYVESPQETARIGSPFKQVEPEPEYDIITQQRELKPEYDTLFGMEVGPFGTVAKATYKTVQDPYAVGYKWGTVGEPAEIVEKIRKTDPYMLGGEIIGGALGIATIIEAPTAISGIGKLSSWAGVKLGFKQPKVTTVMQKGDIATLSYDFDDFMFGIGKGRGVVKRGDELVEFGSRQLYTISKETPGKGRDIRLLGEITGEKEPTYVFTTAKMFKKDDKTAIEKIATSIYGKGDKKLLEIAEFGKPRQKDIYTLKGTEFGRGIATEKGGKKVLVDPLRYEGIMGKEIKLMEITAREGRFEKMLSSFIRQEQRQKLPKDIMIVGKEAPKPLRTLDPMKPFGKPTPESQALKTLLKEQTITGITKTTKQKAVKPEGIEKLVKPLPIYDETEYIRSDIFEPLEIKGGKEKDPFDVFGKKAMPGDPFTDRDTDTFYDQFSVQKTKIGVLPGTKEKFVERERGIGRPGLDTILTGTGASEKKGSRLNQIFRQAEAMKQKQEQRRIYALDSLFRSSEAGRGRGKGKGALIPVIIPIPPPPDPFTPRKKKKRGKKRKSVIRKYRYTPSLTGALRLIDPLKEEPKMVTGLKIRPLISTKGGK